MTEQITRVSNRVASGSDRASWFAELGAALVGVFFPANCRLCDNFLTRADRIPICDDCLASFEPMPRDVCDVCGCPVGMYSLSAHSVSADPGNRNPADSGISPGTSEFGNTVASVIGNRMGSAIDDPVGSEVLASRCPECQAGTFAFDHARSFAHYDGALRSAIVILKFEQIEPLGRWFAQRLTEVLRCVPGAGLPEVVVPVPLHRDRERERGYNQASLIAKPLAKLCGLPYQPVLLARTRPRPDTQILTLEERWASVRGAFAARSGTQVDNRSVLLVDDVLTTGATLDACARVLKQAGAKSVIGITVARATKHLASLTAPVGRTRGTRDER